MTDILILDGGLGTSLEQKYGVKFDSSRPLWSSDLLVSDPDTLLACQRDFGGAPVDILLTATYQVSIEGFGKTKTEAHPDGILKEAIGTFVDDAVTVARKAVKPEASIALSVGPYGACMIPSQEYSGVYDDQHDSQTSLEPWHTKRLQLLSKSIPDLESRVAYVALETVPRVDEIIAMRRALDATPGLSNIPFWISCLYPGDEDLLPDGTTPEDAVKAMLGPTLAKSQPWGIGINCTKTWKLDILLQKYESVIYQLISEGVIKSWPALVLYPDGTSGEVYNTETQTWELPAGTDTHQRESWEVQLANVVKETQRRGQWKQIVVGGCCMASHDDIRRLRSVLKPDISKS